MQRMCCRSEGSITNPVARVYGSAVAGGHDPWPNLERSFDKIAQAFAIVKPRRPWVCGVCGGVIPATRRRGGGGAAPAEVRKRGESMNRRPGSAAEGSAGGAEAPSSLFNTLVRVLLFAAALTVAVWFTYQIRTAVLLFTVAVIVAMVLNAPISWLEGRRWSRGLATLVVMFTVLALSGGLAWLIVPRLLRELPTLVEELPELVADLMERLTAFLGGSPEIDRQLSQLVAWMERGIGEIWRVLDTVGAGLLGALVVLALVLYIVADPRPILRWYVELVPPRHREAATRAVERASKMVVGWVIANAILGGVKAISAFAFLTFMGVPGAAVWSFLALFAALIPRLGFYIMSIPPVVVSLTVSPTTALWTLVFFVVLSETLGNFVAPRVQGEIMELHAAYLLFMTIAMGLAFGLLGVLVASPVAGFIKVYYDEFYLARQPEDPEMESRVDRMMAGAVEGAQSLGKSLKSAGGNGTEE
jgi:putative permease